MRYLVFAILTVFLDMSSVMRYPEVPYTYRGEALGEAEPNPLTIRSLTNLFHTTLQKEPALAAYPARCLAFTGHSLERQIEPFSCKLWSVLEAGLGRLIH